MTNLAVFKLDRSTQVSEMFGGLSICSLEAVVSKEGKEYIIEVSQYTLGLEKII